MKYIQQILIATLFILVTAISSAQEVSVTVTGKVFDQETGKGIEGAQVKLMQEKGGLLQEFETQSDGRFQAQLQQEPHNLQLQAQAKGYNAAEVWVQQPNATVAVNFGLIKQIELSQKKMLPSVYFDFDSSYLTPEAMKILRNIVTYIEQNKEVLMRIKAHTDSRGGDAYNNWLSKRRGERVRNWLIEKGGIEANRIVLESFGRTQLRNHCTDGVNCSAEEHHENRRCDFELVIEE